MVTLADTNVVNLCSSQIALLFMSPFSRWYLSRRQATVDFRAASRAS